MDICTLDKTQKLKNEDDKFDSEIVCFSGVKIYNTTYHSTGMKFISTLKLNKNVILKLRLKGLKFCQWHCIRGIGKAIKCLLSNCLFIWKGI